MTPLAPIEKTITVRTYGYGHDAELCGLPPHGLAETIAILQEALLEIPPEYREQAEVDFSSQWELGETYDRLCITYSRLENDDEAESRQALERTAIVKWIEQEEALIRRRKAEFGIA